MPTQRFMKLSAEKKKRILDAAKNEFIEYKNNYKKASIKRIAEKADIAVGSICKYFDSKDDLFFYLWDQENVTVPFNDETTGYREWISRQLVMIRTLGAAKPDTIYSQIVLNNPDDLSLGLITSIPEGSCVYRRIAALVQRDMDAGLIRRDVTLDEAIFMIFMEDFTTLQYVKRHNIPYLSEKYFETVEHFHAITLRGIYID